MRIALVTLDYPPERGGIARYLGNLVQVSGGAIDVFVNETHQASGPGHVTLARLLRSAWPQWWPMVGFIRSLRAKKYDAILISHALPVGTAAWIAHLFGGPRYVVLIHGLDMRLACSNARKAWLFRRVLGGASLVLANSQFVADEVRRRVASVRPHVLSPGVETLIIPARDSARRQLEISSEAFVLLSVSRLVPRKGIDRVIEALKALSSQTRLVIVGDGNDRERLERLIREHGVGDRVTFVAHATDADRNCWYAAADVFVLPARDDGSDVEGFGIVYLEAALAGLPAIAGRSGGAPEAVEDGKTGRLVEPERVVELTQAIASLMENAEMRKAMGEAGRARALKEFRWEDRWAKLCSWL